MSLLDNACLQKRLDTLYAQDERMSQFSGYILIRNKEELLFSHGYGYADYERKERADQDTIFMIGSITKTFTAVTIHLLAARGLLQLTDPLGRYLPECRLFGHVTVDQLLRHTSGLPDYWNAPGYDQIETSPDAIVRFISGFTLKDEPGARFSYCNANYILLTRIIETVSGAAYEDAVRQHILSPLGMTRTGFIPDYRAYSHVAKGYRTLQPQPERAESLDGFISMGAGSIFSSAADLSVFFDALFGGKLLSGASLQAMCTANGFAYGHGLFVEKDCVWHGGDTKGFSARMTWRNDGILSVLLCNVEGRQEVHMGHFSSMVGQVLRDTLPLLQGFSCQDSRIS